MKKEKWLIWFGLYEIDKNINNSVLSYFSSYKQDVFEYDNITIYVIRSSYAKKPFNQMQTFLENINLYLDKNNANIIWIENIVKKLNCEDFSPTTKAGRILRYLQQVVYKTHPVELSEMRSIKQYIVLWEDGEEWKINVSFGIIDNFFTDEKTYVWQPSYDKAFLEEKIKELNIFKHINQLFFEKENKSWINPNDNSSLYNQYISFLNSKASAKIEWYDISTINSVSKLRINKQLKEHWWKSINAVLNIMKWSKKIAKDYNQHKKLSIDFIHSIQKIVVDETWDAKEPREDKTPWYYRDFAICVLDAQNKQIYPSKSWKKTNKAFIAPKDESVRNLMESLVKFYNKNIGKVDDYILAWILKLMFVIIHPYGDGNGRTWRLLFEWSLLNTWWIDSASLFPISFSINTFKQDYYDALQEVTEPSLYQIDCLEDFINKRFIVAYESDKIFLDLDLTPFLKYIIELGKRCFIDAMYEYKYFKARENILIEVEKFFPNLDKNQKFSIEAVIRGKLKEFVWGKKTDKKLYFLNEEDKNKLKTIIQDAIKDIKTIEIDNLNEEESKMLMIALKEYNAFI